MRWRADAPRSAAAAAATATAAAIGAAADNSTLATAIRTVVILTFAWGIVFATGAQRDLGRLSGHTVLFLVLSGIATGASCLFYFRALQLGKASQVAPIDKLSIVLPIAFAATFLGEGIGWQVADGAALVACGTILIALG